MEVLGPLASSIMEVGAGDHGLSATAGGDGTEP